MKTVFHCLILCQILIAALACQHDPSPIEVLIPKKPTEIPDSCGLKSVTYSKTIKPLLDFYCIGCHGNGSASKGINFEGYENLKLWINADSSRVLGSIRFEKGAFMPPIGKMAHCNIQQIEAWVKGGLKNN
jgi:hypothetical protein